MKYKLTKETKEHDGKILYRIECIEAFLIVHVGDKGGWVESERNLSQSGNAWVYDDAMVFDNALVCGNAQVFGSAKVYGNAKILDNAKVCGDAMVFGNTEVFDNAEVYGTTKVFGDALVCKDAKVCGNANITSSKDYIVFKNNWSNGKYFTWTKNNDKWCEGWFYGTGEELIAKAYEDNENSGKHYEAYVKFVEQLKAIEE